MKLIAKEEMESILKYFPKIELSYETILHKKVYNYDIMVAIPEGIKCFIWFSTYQRQNVCYLLEISASNNKIITNIHIVIASFIDSLCYGEHGTILYGTLFKYKNNKCFTIEDIIYYKGKLIKQTENYYYKLIIFKNILDKEISSISIISSMLIFGLPIISFDKNFNKLLNDIEILPYKVKTIQFRYLYTNNLQQSKTINAINYYKQGNGNKNNNNNNFVNKNIIFKITPDIQNDIYHLHTFENGKFIFYDIACIPDYKTSVFMNKLFRNIKENTNLDSLEESDDEEEFENNKVDKFVFLNKSFKIKCNYNSKFKKWVPVIIADKKDKVITLKEINMQYNNY
jgi:hypothetical protein